MDVVGQPRTPAPDRWLGKDMAEDGIQDSSEGIAADDYRVTRLSEGAGNGLAWFRPILFGPVPAPCDSLVTSQ